MLSNGQPDKEGGRLEQGGARLLCIDSRRRYRTNNAQRLAHTRPGGHNSGTQRALGRVRLYSHCPDNSTGASHNDCFHHNTGDIGNMRPPLLVVRKNTEEEPEYIPLLTWLRHRGNPPLSWRVLTHVQQIIFATTSRKTYAPC